MSNPVFRGWPSVSDLMESPPLRALAARVQPQQLAADVGRLLNKVRAEVHAATADAPAPADLAARVAHWIAAHDTPADRAAINATGAVFLKDSGGPPLSDRAAARLAAAARQASGVSAAESHAASLAAKLAGAESAAVFSNVAGGLATALAALATAGSVIVARGQVLDIDGVPLPELAHCAHTTLCEVGAANHATATQFEMAATGPRAAEQRAKMLLGVAPTTCRSPTQHAFPSWRELADVAHRHQTPLVVDLGMGGLTTTTAIAGLEGVMSAAEAIKAGVDLCFVRGDKLLGGPACGIAVGNARLIERMETHPLRAAWRLDRLCRSGLVAMLEAAFEASRESGENGGQELDADPPALRLLRATHENLRNRAERLAPQLAAAPIIGSAEARVSQAPLVELHDGWEIPSWSVFLQPRSGTAAALLQRLANATPALVGRLAGDHVELNLRSVPPSQDVDLVEAIEQLAP
ncbi:MAG: hypothetical protein ACKO38_16720 [Planctomycetota bacterium]